jgi:hypothetical protein
MIYFILHNDAFMEKNKLHYDDSFVFHFRLTLYEHNKKRFFLIIITLQKMMIWYSLRYKRINKSLHNSNVFPFPKSFFPNDIPRALLPSLYYNNNDREFNVVVFSRTTFFIFIFTFVQGSFLHLKNLSDIISMTREFGSHHQIEYDIYIDFVLQFHICNHANAICKSSVMFPFPRTYFSYIHEISSSHYFLFFHSSKPFCFFRIIYIFAENK